MSENIIGKQQLLTIFRKRPLPLPSWSSGIILLLLIATVSHFFGKLYPLFGGVIFALVIGIIIRNTFGLHIIFEDGISFTVQRMLKVAIILLGATLSFGQILQIGGQSFLTILAVVFGGIFFTILIGKLLKVDQLLSILIGVGTSICGATAITALKGTINAREAQTAYAISTIFLFNLIATFLYPVIGHFLNLNPLQFGIWAGTAIHDTSSVVAVGYLYGNEAGDIATTVKLVRTLFLLPIIILVPLLLVKNDNQAGKVSFKKVFPWFIVGFILMSLFNSVGFISEDVQSSLVSIAKYIILMVMAGVGLQVNLKKMMNIGIKPFAIGLFASVLVSIISLSLIFLLV
ncbi:YeiH family protein [Cytobacillus sp. S13-E01]|uniref:YeiH family protein n=1 Tax=Cytobacillus sp. S13-E01 TaxID=3031326 RepID=UPI0023D87887|nr:YeiH family protein [Cytobacillus sp. S13-E01]MDF0728458.1 YeiH family protein [Cytobacillus sp. S13-E01]